MTDRTGSLYAERAADIAAAVERFCAAVFEPLRAMADAVAAVLPADRRPTLADLAVVEPLAAAELRRPDAYTLTFTVPVPRPDGSMAAVVGSDVYAARAERLLLPALRSGGRPATVLNNAGRVVVSTFSAHATGSLVRSTPERWVRRDGTDVPFCVLVGE